MAGDPSLSRLAGALNDLYRLSGSGRFHDATVAATGVQVTRSGLRFLTMVRDTGPVSATRLAAGLDVSQPTASRVLQQLESAGLVTRKTSLSDGRVSHYLITPQGEQALARVHAYHVTQLSSALEDVPTERRETLAAAVTELVDRLYRDDLAPRTGLTEVSA